MSSNSQQLQKDKLEETPVHKNHKATRSSAKADPCGRTIEIGDLRIGGVPGPELELANSASHPSFQTFPTTSQQAISTAFTVRHVGHYDPMSIYHLTDTPISEMMSANRLHRPRDYEYRNHQGRLDSFHVTFK